MKKTYLEGGRVCNAHGVRGVMKIEPYCDSPAVLSGMKRVFLSDGRDGYEERRVKSASVNGRTVLMSIEGVESCEDAIALKNKIIYLHREDIPIKPGDMLLSDMIGLPVVDFESGRVLGHVTEVQEVPRGKLYSIETERGTVYYPSGPQFIKEISEERGMIVTPIPGFFDDEV